MRPTAPVGAADTAMPQHNRRPDRTFPCCEQTFGEVLGFDEELLAFMTQPIIAVIANVERLKKKEDRARGSLDIPVDFYMRQTGPEHSHLLKIKTFGRRLLTFGL